MKSDTKQPNKVLQRPISAMDQQAFASAILDPTNGVTQKLEAIQTALSPLQREAEEFLTSLDSQSAKSTIRLSTLSQRPARDVIEEQAKAITDMLHAANQVALQVCVTKTTSTSNGRHFASRPTSKRRQKLAKQLHKIRCMKSHLNDPAISPDTSIADLFDKDTDNLLCRAAYDLNDRIPSITREMPLQTQVRSMEEHIRTELASLDKTHTKECHQRAKKRLQKKISKHPKQAHKEIFNNTGEERAGLKALKDPDTGIIESSPDRLSSIVQKILY